MQEVIGSTPIFSTSPFDGIEIFDILTHKTVSNEDFKLEDETEFCVFLRLNVESQIKLQLKV